MKFLMEDNNEHAPGAEVIVLNGITGKDILVQAASRVAGSREITRNKIVDTLDERLNVYKATWYGWKRKYPKISSDPEEEKRRKLELAKEFRAINFESAPGVGKTAIVEEWALNTLGPTATPDSPHSINFVDFSCVGLFPGDVTGITTIQKKEVDAVDAKTGKPLIDKNTGLTKKEIKYQAQIIANEVWDLVQSAPDAVLFLDEFNRASKSQREFMKVFSDRITPGKNEKLDNLWLIIVCTNPKTGADEIEFSEAMTRRMETIEIFSDKKVWWDWKRPKLVDDIVFYTKLYQNEPEKWENLFNAVASVNRYVIADTLMTQCPELQFDDVHEGTTSAGGAFSPATFNQLLAQTSTISGFVDRFSSFCTNKKSEHYQARKAQLERIANDELRDFEDMSIPELKKMFFDDENFGADDSNDEVMKALERLSAGPEKSHEQAIYRDKEGNIVSRNNKSGEIDAGSIKSQIEDDDDEIITDVDDDDEIITDVDDDEIEDDYDMEDDED